MIDDAPDIRMLLRTVLQHSGWTVHEASSGVGVTASLAQVRPDLVILDVQMPDQDGWVTLAEIREHPEFGDVPVILCTVKAAVADRMRGWTIGADGYLVKPFALEAVVHEAEQVAARDAAARDAVRALHLEQLKALEDTHR